MVVGCGGVYPGPDSADELRLGRRGAGRRPTEARGSSADWLAGFPGDWLRWCLSGARLGGRARARPTRGWRGAGRRPTEARGSSADWLMGFLVVGCGGVYPGPTRRTSLGSADEGPMGGRSSADRGTRLVRRLASGFFLVVGCDGVYPGPTRRTSLGSADEGPTRGRWGAGDVPLSLFTLHPRPRP
ncbi:hypothetical protein GGR28_002139 [Lewinella aquimaris]|uniref:Uncharacterized protein n=1 Tax=Neolewinella aquimaris TaxID=1835722 RepID=A0A840E1T2_9BACT|nr:hypothetical protein [Neolewinella aquimaris]